MTTDLRDDAKTSFRNREDQRPSGRSFKERKGSRDFRERKAGGNTAQSWSRTERNERKLWKEEPMNLADLTEEEREERFRAQIKSPVTLTTFIQRAKTPGEFMWTITAAMEETMLNHIHLAAAFNKLASLKKTTPLVEKIRRSPTLVQLAKQAARVADRREFRAREIASMLMSCAALRVDLPWISKELGVSLAKSVPQTVKDMNPQALSNTVYGLGVLDLGDSPEVSAAIDNCASVIPAQLGRFSSMDVAQVAWGIGARDGREDNNKLMGAIAKWVAAESENLPAYAASVDLPMIAVAFVRLQNWQPEMMNAIARRLSDLSRLRLWSLAALFWSWSHPCSPATETAELDPLPARFLQKLRKQTKWRQITQEDIDRVPEGPKGETSKSWSSKSANTLSVAETF
eukprot:Skav225654  [mRNA]  locus=scaffold4659:90959:92164:- [translate_table: standard]